jgi:ribokinase
MMATTPRNSPDVAVVGSFGVGLTMTLERVPNAGETVRADSYAEGPGGKGSNQAVAAARLGARVSLCSIVGDDAFGAIGRRVWEEEGVDAAAVVTGHGATMAGFILVEADGENRIAIAPGVLDELTPAHICAFSPTLAAADILLTSLEIPLPAVREALRIARTAGVTTVLNPAPSLTIDDATFALVDHLIPNRTEAEVLSQADASASPDTLLGALRERMGRGVIVLTLGGDGAIVDDGAGRHHLPSHPAPVVDTTGAGDAFSAGYAVAIAEGASARDAAAFAMGCGAFAVTRPEVLAGLPRRHEVMARA